MIVSCNAIKYNMVKSYSINYAVYDGGMGENMKKSFIAFILAFIMLFTIPATANAKKQTVVHIAVDNEIVHYPKETQPYIDGKGNAQIPLFATSDKLGTTIEWSKNLDTIIIKHDKDIIKVTRPSSGKNTIIMRNNKVVKTSISPIIKKQEIYVSLEFLATFLHCQTSWDNRVHTAFVTLPNSTKKGQTIAGNTTTSELLKIKSFDGYTLTGKLDLPVNVSNVSTLVIFVPGTGPNTYDNHRLIGGKEFNYYDLFATELGKRQVGFFRYNTRGVDLGTTPPMYDTIDKTEYVKYTPLNQAQDIEAMITELKKNEKLKDAKIVLLGWSEGTIVAPLVAERKKVEVSSLMLAGYCNEKMQDIIEWQLSGASSMIFYCRYFDVNFDGVISKKEFNADPNGLILSTLGGVKFEQLDMNKDKKLTKADFATILTEQRNNVLNAIAKGDDEWLWNNYFQITSEWLTGHANLKANKDTLLKLDLPVSIFNGVYDQNVPLQGVYDIYDTYQAKGKTNMKAFVFDQNDHDLNYIQYPLYNVIPESFVRIFDECAKVK